MFKRMIYCGPVPFHERRMMLFGDAPCWTLQWWQAQTLVGVAVGILVWWLPRCLRPVAAGLKILSRGTSRTKEATRGLIQAFLWSACILSWPALGADDVGDVVYRPAVELARLEDPRINESSGLARCHSRDDAVWTHNDSGDSARLFLIATSGQTLGTAEIEGVQPLDWEDMCSFRHNAKNYLLVGDIGDNDQARAELTLCVVEEPDASTTPSPANWRLQPIALIPLQLHGGPRDCEALAVDPATGSILLAGKSLGGKCRIYQASWAWPPLPNEPDSTPLATGTRSAVGASQPLTAKQIALTDIPLATGMDVSADGRRAVIVSYVGAYEFTRRDGEDWAAAFSRPPRVLRMPLRSQGEAICYGADDRSLYLTSEGRSQPLWWVPAQKPAAP